MPTIYSVNSASVASEVIDDEAIIMNLATGNYHSARGLGALLWQAMVDGVSGEDILAALEARYPGRDVATDFDTFVTQAREASLVVPGEGESRRAMPPLECNYAAPVLESFGDMADLIMLDPIHDVSDQHGWPVRPGAERADV